MATLSPFIKTASSSSIINHSGTTTITKTSPSGRLSLLSSDIEEDLGILDLNSNEFQYIHRHEYWLLNDDEYDPKIHLSYDILLEWIDGYLPMKSYDDYKKFFHINNFSRDSTSSSIINDQNNSHRNQLTPGKFVFFQMNLFVI